MATSEYSPAPTMAAADTATPARRAWAALAVLFALQVTWSMDRTLPMLLVEPLREAFDLNDKQIGLAVGLAYGASYGICGLLVGPLLDKFNRVRMLTAMLVCWSGLTVVCGYVASFPQLLLARVGVGAAESGGSPASYAIIADIFPKNRRATAMGLLKVGSPLGIVAATAIAGSIAVEYGWRAAFLVAGLPGLLLAFVVLMVIPGGRKGASRNVAEPFSLGKALAFIGKAPGIPWLIAGVILYMFANAGIGAFTMPLFQRVHGISLKNMSFIYGLGTVLSCLGPITAAIISDRLMRGNVRHVLYFFCVIAFSCILASSLMALSPGIGFAIAGMMAWHFISAGMSAPAFGTLLSLTPPQMRGTVAGSLSAAMYLLGIGPAPFFTGLISDAMGGGAMVRYAVVLIGMVNIAAICFFLMRARSLARFPPSEVE